VSLVGPYPWGFGAWFVVQMFTASWKLHREREDALDLPVDLFAYLHRRDETTTTG
jgi:hypothetical protein